MRLRKQIRNEFFDGLVICLAIMLALMFSGCAGTQFAKNPIPETPKGKYITARKFYNDQVEALTVYGTLLTAKDKAELKKTIDPVFDSIEATLDGWKIALMDPAKDAAAYNSAWLKLRQKMVTTIAKYLDDD
jgi:thiamine biosynthesis lipoprotein ApbE